MLAGKNYCPILHARSAEIKALKFLPEASKDILFPLVVGRPWPNANHLLKTWEKISEAFGDRRFALDIDAFKRGVPSKKAAAAEFDALFDPKKGFKNYYKEISSVDNAIPVFQFENGSIPDLYKQIEHIEKLDRGVVLRLQHGIVLNPKSVVEKVLTSYPDATIFVDMSWSKDLISHELWASGILNSVSDIEPEAEVVLSGSSFPESFRKKPKDEIEVQERTIFDNLVRKHNSVSIIYGDWASTRSPKPSTPMGKIPPRIDVPFNREWISYRSENGESFVDVAKRAVEDPTWPKDNNIWGVFEILNTASQSPSAIKGPQAAAAARINIHLHRQASFGISGMLGDSDEPYID